VSSSSSFNKKVFFMNRSSFLQSSPSFSSTKLSQKCLFEVEEKRIAISASERAKEEKGQALDDKLVSFDAAKETLFFWPFFSQRRLICK